MVRGIRQGCVQDAHCSYRVRYIKIVNLSYKSMRTNEVQERLTWFTIK